MPCSSDGYPSTGSNHGSCNVEIDNLTRMLCEAMHVANGDTKKSQMSPELLNWWKKHEEFDRQRLEKELKEAEKKALVDRAIAKLTPEERRALNL